MFRPVEADVAGDTFLAPRKPQAYPGIMRLSLIVWLIGGCTALAGVGCGSGSSAPDTLTCDWLASDANCWKSTALMATTCLPASSEMGTFSADGSTCTYGSGALVTFTPPLTLPLATGTGATDMKWNFTVTDSNGQSCLRYQDTGTAVTLTVGGKTVTEGLSGSVGIAISCPDGTRVQNSNAFNLLNCPDGGFTNAPGIEWSSSGSTTTPFSVNVGITGTGDFSLPVFNCSTQ